MISRLGIVMIDLEIQRALEHLQSKFAHATDRRDYAMMKSVYHDDAYDDHGTFQGPVDNYINWVKDVQNSFEICSHVNTNMLCSVKGDRAVSEARGTTYLRMKGPQPHNVMVIGRHFDTYERRSGTWKFIHRALCVDWVQVFEPANGSLDVISSNPRGMMGQDDPVYARVPDLIAALRQD